MYKISVPVDNGNLSDIGRENVLSELKKVGAERVFLLCTNTKPTRLGVVGCLPI